MRSCTRRTLWAVLLASSALLCGAASAHEMSIAELRLQEAVPGEFIIAWGTPAKVRPIAEDLRPQWPEGCTADVRTVRCSTPDMVGTFNLKGLGQAYSAAVVTVRYLDGQQRVYTLTSTQPSVRLGGVMPDGRGSLEVASRYVALGIEHILSGADHLLFVISLLFLVGFQRQLVWTLTAFTAAHSITLACSALGLLTLRPPPVEACIALSIILVSAEALHHRKTLSQRWPALVAFLFGLVHGLGFAGALKDIGLPQDHLFVSLLGFNVGVELGQFLVVGLAWGLVQVLRRLPVTAQLRIAILYGIGTVATYWSLARIVAVASV